MSNHIHLIAIPERPDSFALGIGQTDGLYAQWFNRRYRRVGHLWQARFNSCALGRTHLITALAYVDLNPVRARMVPSAVEYEWSSASAHCMVVAGGGLGRNRGPAPFGLEQVCVGRTWRGPPGVQTHDIVDTSLSGHR